MPDQVVDDKKTIKLGDTMLELIYVGRNHSDNSRVMRLPKEKLVFVVDFAPDRVGPVPQYLGQCLAAGIYRFAEEARRA